MKGQTVQQALAALIERAGLSQTAIADELKCTQANIHYHLNSAAANPRTPATLEKRLMKLLWKHRVALAGNGQSLKVL